MSLRPRVFPEIPEPIHLSPGEEDSLGRLAAAALRECTSSPELAEGPELEAPGTEDHAPGKDGPEDLPGPASSTGLAARVGVFVTLLAARELRGCIGTAEGRHPLYVSVPRLARAAACRDRRFPPLRREELRQVDIEITVLGMPVLLASDFETILDGLVPGRHGVRVCHGDRSGLLLPQVALRFDWRALDLLEQVSLKAGLPRDGWRDPAAEVFAFRARSFEAGSP